MLRESDGTRPSGAGLAGGFRVGGCDSGPVRARQWAGRCLGSGEWSLIRHAVVQEVPFRLKADGLPKLPL